MKNSNHSLEHTGTPYVFSGQGESPNPVVTILGGIHGNEKAGIKVVKKLISKSHHQPIQNGTLQAAIGNIAAMKAGKRFVDQDLNRSFGKPKGTNAYEEFRATQLKPFLEKTGILMDIHSTIKPSDPFIAIPDKDAFLANKALIATLGIPTIITGEGLWPEDGEPIYADTFVQANNGFGMTIEAGCIDDPKTMEIMHGINAALHHLQIFDGQYDQAPTEKEFIVWHAKQNIVAPIGFTFQKDGKPYDWNNFEEVPIGTVYATANDQEFVAAEDLWMIFPKSNSKIVTGDEACILAKKLK